MNFPVSGTDPVPWNLTSVREHLNSNMENITRLMSATLFGSGWARLEVDQKGRLSIIQESNAGNPIRNGFIPILTCDVWEHAYYLDYQNRRPAYIEVFWNLVDWEVANQRLSDLESFFQRFYHQTRDCIEIKNFDRFFPGPSKTDLYCITGNGTGKGLRIPRKKF